MGKKFKRIISNLIEVWKRPDMKILPGQLAFYFILSLVPTLTLLFYFASFVHISISDITSYFNVSIGQELISILTPSVGETKFSFSLLILIVVGIYLASNGMNSIIVTANSIYGIEQKSFIERRVKAIIMVFITILLFLFILLVPVLGSFLFDLVEKLTGYGGLKDFLNFLKLPFSWFTIFFFIKLLYTIAPDKEVSSHNVNIGALFTSILWVLATEVYLYYAGHFANYNIYYSGLSNIAILMIWVYLLASIFIMGMGINEKEEVYEVEKTKELSKIDNTNNTQNKLLEKK